MDDSPFRASQLYTSRPPDWLVWHAPQYGPALFRESVYDTATGLISITLAYMKPDDSTQVFIRSGDSRPSVERRIWYVEQAADAESGPFMEIFPSMPKIFEADVSAASSCSTKLDGTVISGLRAWRRSAEVAIFVPPDGKGSITLWRNNVPFGGSLSEFTALPDLQDSEIRGQQVLQEFLRQNPEFG